MLRRNILKVAMAGAIVAASALSLISSSTTALAFDCGGGSGQGQQDATYSPNSGYALHGWLGYCDNYGYAKYYAGEDSHWPGGGSHRVDYMSIHLRAWWCGTKRFDQTASNNNQGLIQLTTPEYNNLTCGHQADLSGYESVSGQWSWSYYLNY